MKPAMSLVGILCACAGIGLVLLATNKQSPHRNTSFLQVLATPTTPIPESISPTPVKAAEQEVANTPLPTSQYLEIVDSCGPHYEGACVRARSGPGTTSPIVAKLRTGVVLKVGEVIETPSGTWYKISYDEWLRYPERVTDAWYVESSSVRLFQHAGEIDLPAGSGVASTSKHILVDRTTQTLTAYDGDTVFMQLPVSTGLDLTPTPRGTFTIYKKTPSRYMQGPLPGVSDQYYDLPGVPWNLYFTQEGGAIHGAYWHNNFGQQWSHGCVNLPPAEAEKLYEWADVGTPVVVRD